MQKKEIQSDANSQSNAHHRWKIECRWIEIALCTDTPPTVLLLVIQAAWCNEPLTPLQGRLLLTMVEQFDKSLSSSWCHTEDTGAIGMAGLPMDSIGNGKTLLCRMSTSYYYTGVS